jgi:hypothetical protein
MFRRKIKYNNVRSGLLKENKKQLLINKARGKLWMKKLKYLLHTDITPWGLKGDENLVYRAEDEAM